MKKTMGQRLHLDEPVRTLPDFLQNNKERKTEDLNYILGNILQNLKHQRTPSVIRCDELPLVQGNKEKLTNTFQYILDFILSYPPDTERLFLYVKCDIARTDYIDMSINSYEKTYKISFQTNSEANAELFPPEHSKYCSGSIAEIKGKFTTNTEPGTGWLFNLVVPGKLKQ